MGSKEKKLSLADKISGLVTAAPTGFDSDDDHDETSAKLVERDIDEEESDSDVRQSSFRKQNLTLLTDIDKRYEGKKVSRKILKKDHSLSSDTEEGSGSNDSDDEEQVDEESDKAEESDLGTDNDKSDELDGEDETDLDEEPEHEIDETNPLLRRDKNVQSNFKHMSSTDLGDEIEKGKCVRTQLSIWENLLEMRIKLQKCLVSSNKIPQFDIYEKFITDKTFSTNTNQSKNNLHKLLNNLLELQSTLLKNYPETRKLIKDNGVGNNIEEKVDEDDMDEEIPSDTDDEMLEGQDKEEDKESKEEEEDETTVVPRKKRKLTDYESLISKNHNLYTSYRNSVIQKWNDKTRVAVGNINNKGSTQPVVKQIEFILSDKSKLRKRTQLKRSEYQIIGKKDTTEEQEDGRRTQEYDVEIYDDDDFYHQLLRELIEFKSADVTDPIQLSKQWIQLQNMRSKMKRKIDTKATKGRRIRFGVHSKLVNFMAPIKIDDQWSDEAKTELYNSLFGKIKEVEQN